MVKGIVVVDPFWQSFTFVNDGIDFQFVAGSPAGIGASGKFLINGVESLFHPGAPEEKLPEFIGGKRRLCMLPDRFSILNSVFQGNGQRDIGLFKWKHIPRGVCFFAGGRRDFPPEGEVPSEGRIMSSHTRAGVEVEIVWFPLLLYRAGFF